MKRFIPLAALLLFVCTLSTSASAYVGPGAGLSLLGAFWALIVAVGTAIGFVVAWPVRKLLRRNRRSNRTAATAAPRTEAGQADPS